MLTKEERIKLYYSQCLCSSICGLLLILSSTAFNKMGLMIFRDITLVLAGVICVLLVAYILLHVVTRKIFYCSKGALYWK